MASELPTSEDWHEEDWTYVFPSAADTAYSGTFVAGSLTGEPAPHVTRDRIAEVLHFHADSPEGYASVDMFAVARLADGQYAVTEAWADTTGWGCRDDAWWKVGPTLDSVIAELSPANRRRISAGAKAVDD